jgi:hypothetical protein
MGHFIDTRRRQLLLLVRAHALHLLPLAW